MKTGIRSLALTTIQATDWKAQVTDAPPTGRPRTNWPGGGSKTCAAFTSTWPAGGHRTDPARWAPVGWRPSPIGNRELRRFLAPRRRRRQIAEMNAPARGALSPVLPQLNQLALRHTVAPG